MIKGYQAELMNMYEKTRTEESRKLTQRREEQCRKQGCWWKREKQLAKKQHHTGSTCR